MRKLVAVVCGAALMGASGLASAQASSGPYANNPTTGSTAGKSVDFKKMDANSDGWVSREEYLGFYGARYDTMKRNDKGMVSWSDMQASDGRFFQPGTTSNTTGNPTTNQAGTKGGSGNPPASGGGSK
jgi:hypothetical protein